jgi:hypothetical protein
MNENIKKTILGAMKEVDGLELYGETSAKSIEFKKIKKHNNEKNKTLLNWNNKDFALYILDSFKKKYSKELDFKILGVTLYICNIQSELVRLIGFCDNVVLKDYIDFYFDRWCSNMMPNNEFYINSLKNEKCIKDFGKNYNYRENINSKNIVEKDHKKEIDLSLQISLENLVLDYGIIISINYLILKKEDPKSAMRKVSEILIKHKNNLKVILSKTKELSPYPEKLKFKKYKEYLAIISKLIDSKIEDDVLFTNKKNEWDCLL